MKNKKNFKKFKEILDVVEKNKLFSEREYNALTIIIQNLISKTANYIFESDFQSKKNLNNARNYVKAIKKFDTNINTINSEQIETILEHINTINYLLNEINNIIKKK